MLSTTVTVIEQVAVLLLISVTVQTMVVVPRGYTPLALLVPLNEFTTDTTEQLSAAVGAGTVTLLVQVPAVVNTLIFAGQVIVGLILSFKVTLKEQVAALPLASVAVMVTGTTVP
jgi:hypothetical protein